MPGAAGELPEPMDLEELPSTLDLGSSLAAQVGSLEQSEPQQSAPEAAVIVPKLQNIVATCSVGMALNLRDITMQSRNAEYNPKRFAACIMRIRDPKTTALIFGSGKIVVTGAKDEDQSLTAARRYARIIQKCNNMGGVTFREFKIQNVVASCDVQFPIRLEGLVAAHRVLATYEPELFPGLIYKMVSPRLTLLIFVSGKVVFTGAKKKEDIDKAFEQIYPVLKQYQKV